VQSDVDVTAGGDGQHRPRLASGLCRQLLVEAVHVARGQVLEPQVAKRGLDVQLHVVAVGSRRAGLQLAVLHPLVETVGPGVEELRDGQLARIRQLATA